MDNFFAIRHIKPEEFNSPDGTKNICSKLEARISIQMDYYKQAYDKKARVSFSGYANLWNWNPRTVKSFIENTLLMKIKRDNHNINSLGILEPTKEAIKLGNDSPIILDKNTYISKPQ